MSVSPRRLSAHKVARSLEEVADLYDSAVREAVTAFGGSECFVVAKDPCPIPRGVRPVILP